MRRNDDFDPSALKEARRRRGLTQSGLAARLDVSAAALKTWEQGRRTPLPGTLAALADALDVDVATLVPGAPDVATADLATIRRSRGLDDTRAAEALGISRRTLARVESGRQLPPVAADWARVYRLTQAELAAAWKRSR